MPKFVKGQSGNPSGISKRTKDVAIPRGSAQRNALATKAWRRYEKKFFAEMDGLTGKPFLDKMVALLEYKEGKLARTEITSPDGSLTPKVRQVFIIGGTEIEL
jgi:hypothetical protein